MDNNQFDQCDETCTSDCGHCKGRRFGPFADLSDPNRMRAELDDDLYGGMVAAVITVVAALIAAALICLAFVWLVR